MIIKSVSDKVFNDKVKVKFENINDGFEKYENRILEGKDISDSLVLENKIIKFIENAFELNGEENSYIDFYYFKLSDEDKQKIEDMLPDEDKKILKEIKQYQFKGIYFYLTKELIHFIVRLSTREILFSTIYFTKVPCTVWGNYGMRFPCFFETKENIDIYKIISEDLGLKI